MERTMFYAEDIIETVKELSEQVTDDCTWNGVLLLACELLGCSEETLEDMIEN